MSHKICVSYLILYKIQIFFYAFSKLKKNNIKQNKIKKHNYILYHDKSSPLWIIAC